MICIVFQNNALDEDLTWRKEYQVEVKLILVHFLVS
jgi:hypothetical protein